MTRGTAVTARTASAGRSVRRARVAAVAVAVTLAGGTGTVATAAGTTPLPCEQLGVSPDFAHDGTAFCAGTEMTGFAATGLAVFTTTDKGRTWRRATAAGLPYKAGDRMADLVVSPLYASDHTIFVTVTFEGVYASTDAGETFTPVLLGSWPLVTPFVAGVGGVAPGRRTLLMVPRWSTGTPALVDPVLRTVEPVPGPPGQAVAVTVSPAWSDDHTAVAFTHATVNGMPQVVAYACSVAFECTTRLGTLPAGYAFHHAWLAADFASSRTMFVEVVPEASGHTPLLYVSRDAGRTFTPMSKAQALVNAHLRNPRLDYEPVVALDAGRPGTDRVWMRLYGTETNGLPAMETYRSDDNGQTWVRVAYGRIGSGTPRGTMQVRRVPPRELQPRVLLAATGDDHLFVNGITQGGWGVSCSSDGGRTWTTTCR
jgi:hypothetical protein